MYHVDLYQAPHRLRRLNLSEQQLRSNVLEPWLKGEPFEMGERLWSSQAAQLVVLEGPEVPVGQLTMGRGWSVAARGSVDVTDRVLSAVRQDLANAAAEHASAAAPFAGPHTPAAAGLPATDVAVLADALGMELLRGLGNTPMELVHAWRIAGERHPQVPPSISLEIAQRAVASLAEAGLVRITRSGAPSGEGLQGEELDTALTAVHSWTVQSGADALWIRRI